METWLKRFGVALDWPFNLSKRGKISDPFGDYDGDGLQNLNDCDPRNSKKQDIQGPVAMGAAGQAQQTMAQQKISVKQPTEQVVIVAETPVSQPNKPRPKTILEMRGPMGAVTSKIIPSRLGPGTSPKLPQ